MNVWELASILSKFLIYAGMLSAIGGGLMVMSCRQQPALVTLIARHYLMPALLTGLLATCLFFLVQIGSVNQRGLSGMFDPLIGSILVETEIGSALRWRLGGFMLALICLVAVNWPGYPLRHNGVQRVCVALAVLAAACLMVSVAVQGHSSAVSWLAQTLVGLHVLAIGAWAGALVPLSLMVHHSRALQVEPLYVADQLRQFGTYAAGMLLVMVASGLSLFWLLTDGFATLFSTLYGQLFLVKVLTVAAMMALGALHKFRWVPRVRHAAESTPDDETALKVLGRSIRVETVLAVVVLMITASMTTITGPSAG